MQKTEKGKTVSNQLNALRELKTILGDTRKSLDDRITQFHEKFEDNKPCLMSGPIIQFLRSLCKFFKLTFFKPNLFKTSGENLAEKIHTVHKLVPVMAKARALCG